MVVGVYLQWTVLEDSIVFFHWRGCHCPVTVLDSLTEVPGVLCLVCGQFTLEHNHDIPTRRSNDFDRGRLVQKLSEQVVALVILVFSMHVLAQT